MSLGGLWRRISFADRRGRTDGYCLTIAISSYILKVAQTEANGIVYDFRKFKILFMNTKYRVIAPTDAPADMQRAVNRYQS